MLNLKCTLFFSGILCSLIGLQVLNGQTPVLAPAQPDPALRRSLEGLYESWRSALAKKDLAAWEQVTALSRQIQIRNRIVSEKAPFPRAFFDDPIQAPSLGGLVALGCFNRGETATSVYFGKADFGLGVDPSQITDNLLVLAFMKDDGIWKFDKLRIVKIGNDGEILLKIRNQDFSFLKGIEFQPPLSVPPIPQPVNQPDYIAELWITSIGYEVEIIVNGNLSATIINASSKELVIGGVQRGKNSIEIKTKPLTEIKGNGTPKVEVAIYAQIKKGNIKRVYHYRPEEDIEAIVKADFSPPVE